MTFQIVRCYINGFMILKLLVCIQTTFESVWIHDNCSLTFEIVRSYNNDFMTFEVVSATTTFYEFGYCRPILKKFYVF